MEYDIFISYSRADSAIVNTFVQQLEAAGYEVWIDKAGIYTGTRFKSVLVKAIENSKVFLFFSSKDANASRWTANEIAIAIDRQKTIIPVKLDATHYNPDVEFDLINLDFVDYKKKSNRDQELNKLMRTLEKIFDKKPPRSQQLKEETSETEGTKEAKGNWFTNFIKNHRGWAISLAAMSSLLIVGVPLYCSRMDSNLSPEELQFKAVKQYTAAAEQGDAEAQYHLGVCYEKGEGVTQSYKEAVKWYQKAAEQGYAEAQSNLALCYENGHGVTGSYEEAAKWFIKAAEQGYAYAQYRLGDYYFYGHYFKKNTEEAMKWYKKAAEQGYDEAQNRLGHCYFEGRGVPQNHSEAAKWYKMAAEQGYAESQYWLGYCYFEGYGVERDNLEAVKWQRKAAEQGDKDWQRSLGDRYYEGWGVIQDFEEAIKWYRMSAQQSDRSSQYRLGRCYYKIRDYHEAVKWYKMAAEQGLDDAQYELGRCYEEGHGVEIDREEALKWYKKAAKQGHKDAKSAVERLTKPEGPVDELKKDR